MAHRRTSLTDTTADSDAYSLKTVQEPQQAKVYLQRDKDRKPLEPPPVVEILLNDHDPYKNFLSSPYYFMCATLHDANKADSAHHCRNTELAGTLVSSLHRVKDTENNDAGYFVFQDLSIRREGEFFLKFSLFELRRSDAGMTASYITSLNSKSFKVYSSAKCPPPLPSTLLTKHLQEQGVKLRTKKTQNPHGRRARRPEEWSSELPPPNHPSLANRLPIPRSLPDGFPNRFPSPYSPDLFRRGAGRNYPAHMDPSFPVGENPYNQSLFGPESTSYRQLARRDEPPQKRQRRNSSFPEVDTRYVLASHKGSVHSSTEDPTTPHSASASFGENLFSQYSAPNRSTSSPSRNNLEQARRQYPFGESTHYPTPDSVRHQVSNRLSMGSDMAMGMGGMTDPQQHHYPSSAETQASPPAPVAMHPPVMGMDRTSTTSDPRYWPGQFDNTSTYAGYHSRGSSINAIPTGHLLPAPVKPQPRSSMENNMQSL